MSFKIVELYDENGRTVTVGVNSDGELNIESYDESDPDNEATSFDVYLPHAVLKDLHAFLGDYV